MKPLLTTEQKDRFDREFLELINQSSQSVIDLWNDRKVDYSTGEPITYGVENKLVGELANKYHILINKALNRTL